MFSNMLDLWKRRLLKVLSVRLRMTTYVLNTTRMYFTASNLISTSAHTVRTVHRRKVGFTAFDTKRWLWNDTIHAHSYGHRDTVDS